IEEKLAREIAERECINRGTPLQARAQGAERPLETQIGEQHVRGEERDREYDRSRRKLVNDRRELGEIDRDEHKNERRRRRKGGHHGLQATHGRLCWTVNTATNGKHSAAITATS